MAPTATPAPSQSVIHLSAQRKPATESFWNLPPMALSTSRRYGEPDFQGSPLHSELHQALSTKTSYEEDRLTKYCQSPAAVDGAAKVASAFSFSSLADKTDMVKVIVGEFVQQTWLIHEHLLTAVSDFAKTALSSGGKEQEEKIILLPEENPYVFEFFVKYVYTSIIDVPTLDRKLQLYILADRLKATEICRKIHISLALFWDTLSNAQISFVLANTAPGDALRHSCLDKLCHDMSFKAKQFPEDFSTVLCEDYASEILAKMMGKYDAIILAPSKAVGTIELSSPVDKGKKSTGFFGRPPPQSPEHSKVDTSSGSGLFGVPVTTTSTQSIFGSRPALQNGSVTNSSTAVETSTLQITTTTSVPLNNSSSSGSASGTAANAPVTTARDASLQSAAVTNTSTPETSLTASAEAQTSNLTASFHNLKVAVITRPA